ncbi:hypothetical protein V9N53_003389 [Vibrio cholerae]
MRFLQFGDAVVEVVEVLQQVDVGALGIVSTTAFVGIPFQLWGSWAAINLAWA